jgi:hypothetical protein
MWGTYGIVLALKFLFFYIHTAVEHVSEAYFVSVLCTKSIQGEWLIKKKSVVARVSTFVPLPFTIYIGNQRQTLLQNKKG